MKKKSKVKSVQMSLDDAYALIKERDIQKKDIMDRFYDASLNGISFFLDMAPELRARPVDLWNGSGAEKVWKFAEKQLKLGHKSRYYGDLY